MALGYSLANGAKGDRATYTTGSDGNPIATANASAVPGYEISALVSSGPTVLMSMSVMLPLLGANDHVWIQVYDRVDIPAGNIALAQFIRRSPRFQVPAATQGENATWDWYPGAADEVEDQYPQTRTAHIASPDPDKSICPCRRIDCDPSFPMLPIKGYPFTKGIVVMLSSDPDTLTRVENGLRVNARLRYGTDRGVGR